MKKILFLLISVVVFVSCKPVPEAPTRSESEWLHVLDNNDGSWYVCSDIIVDGDNVKFAILNASATTNLTARCYFATLDNLCYFTQLNITDLESGNCEIEKDTTVQFVFKGSTLDSLISKVFEQIDNGLYRNQHN